MRGQAVENVHNYTYLGSQISSSDGWLNQQQRRIEIEISIASGKAIEKSGKSEDDEKTGKSGDMTTSTSRCLQSFSCTQP